MKRAFQHFRFLGANGKPKPLGGATLLTETADDGTTYFAIGICAPEENFCYSTGRAIAAGRMRADDNEMVSPLSNTEAYVRARYEEVNNSHGRFVGLANLCRWVRSRQSRFEQSSK